MSQKLIVKVTSTNNFQAVMFCTEDDQVIKKFSVVIGKNGVTADKKEGDGKTPLGTYNISHIFGLEKQESSKMPYSQIQETWEWVDDPDSSYYNLLVDSRIPKMWNSSEKMIHKDGLYKYVGVIDYNYPKVEKGKGSAIFIHLWRSSESGTEGCIAMSEENLEWLVNWLDKDNNPMVEIV